MEATPKWKNAKITVCKTKSKMPKKIMPWGKKRNMKGSRRNPTAAPVVATILKPVKEDSVETATVITLILALRGPAVEATPRKDGQMNKSLIFKVCSLSKWLQDRESVNFYRPPRESLLRTATYFILSLFWIKINTSKCPPLYYLRKPRPCLKY